MITAPAPESTSIIALSWLDLALASALVLVAMAISAWQRLGLVRGFAIGAVRAVVQLVAVGYVLAFLMATRRWYLVLLTLLVMLVAATITATERQKKGRAGLFMISGTAMLIGAGLTLTYVDAVVLRLRPWYDPQYLIPLFGMIIGNAMNGAALAADRMNSEMELRRGEVEAYLALGASPARASAEAMRRALVAALMPTLNGLMVVGLVSLPGMMTGQVIAGQSPVTAVRYQIVVVFMLAGAVALTSLLVALWYRRSFFTPAEQLAERRAV
ncbi:MAG TPA: iron export ABC transporter permease subunit FetB [Gemmatimonadaceae bacterium]|jgi:putative ABC transport system permease protein|nr:iron export ABC transporter permease subunit FetB [Gemmatimonadaceae bacterium]